jgi:nucleoside-diphosphate-sugar epimerase
MRVVVTGANSFLGRHVVRHLSGCGLAVVGTYRNEGAATEELKASSAKEAGERAVAPEFVRVDLADRGAFSRLPQSIDGIVHVAGVSTAEGVTIDDMFSCNVEGGRNVLRYALAAKASRLVYCSTMSVYGKVAEPVVDETTPIRDPDCYGASKYLAERMFAAEAERLACAAVRLPGVLGRGAHRAWIPTLLASFRSNRPITVYNPDTQLNNAAYVDDLAALFLEILRSSRPGFFAFPVGADGAMTVSELLALMAKLTDSSSSVTARIESRPTFTISSDFAKRTFGYKPQTIGEIIERYCRDEGVGAGLRAGA